MTLVKTASVVTVDRNILVCKTLEQCVTAVGIIYGLVGHVSVLLLELTSGSVRPIKRKSMPDLCNLRCTSKALPQDKHSKILIMPYCPKPPIFKVHYVHYIHINGRRNL